MYLLYLYLLTYFKLVLAQYLKNKTIVLEKSIYSKKVISFGNQLHILNEFWNNPE